VSETARETDRPGAGRSAANADPPETVSDLLAATGESREAAAEPGMERMREAAQGAAAQAEETGGLGRLGRPMDRRSPFFIGLAGAAGVAVTIGLVELVIRARSVLVLIGLALFIAVGLDPVVNWLTRRRVPRWAAVIMDLIPVIGSTIGGAVVTLVALTVSLPVAIATLAFYIGYRLAEDYLLVPRIMGSTVKVPAVVSLVAVLVGGALMGIVGALVAILAAAALRLLLDEVTFRRLDRS
jgi:predicted PurR-regulated permease PerM